MSGPGRYTVLGRNEQGLWGRLSNFDVGQAIVKRGHADGLEEEVVGILQNGGSVRLIGLASPTGNPGFRRRDGNLTLSRDRANAVLAHLRSVVQSDFRVTLNTWQGEQAALAAGVPVARRDGPEHENWRSVMFSAWSRPTPPPPPPARRGAHQGQRVRRYVERYWSELGRPSNLWRPSTTGSDIGRDAWRSLIDMVVDWLSSRPDTSREVQEFAENDRVNRVVISVREWISVHGAFGIPTAELNGKSTTVQYEWGPPRQNVEIQYSYRFERDRRVLYENSRQESIARSDRYSDFYPPPNPPSNVPLGRSSGRTQ